LTADQVPEVSVRDSNYKKHNSTTDVGIKSSDIVVADKSEVHYIRRSLAL